MPFWHLSLCKDSEKRDSSNKKSRENAQVFNTINAPEI